LSLDTQKLIVRAVAVVADGVVEHRVKYTKTGKAMRAFRSI
jgi:hypothetical protein